MFTYNLSDKLRKRVNKLAKKDRILALIFKKKIYEVINQDKKSINVYKNLKSPKNEFKRIHLTGNFVLLFRADIAKNHIVFVDILHWDRAYK
jgi:mRNA-degrading endonuclease RelE of RelBE toxin-antitoxin system